MRAGESRLWPALFGQRSRLFRPKEPAFWPKAGSSFGQKPALSGQSRLPWPERAGFPGQKKPAFLAKEAGFCYRGSRLFWPKKPAFGQKEAGFGLRRAGFWPGRSRLRPKKPALAGVSRLLGLRKPALAGVSRLSGQNRAGLRRLTPASARIEAG